MGPEGVKVLGNDPVTGLPVSLRRGPYGPYVQLGENGVDAKAPKPKRASVLKSIPLDELTLEKALALLSLPREVGRHPETGHPITAGIGRFGPYLRHDGRYVSLKGDDDVLTIGLNRAVTLLAEAPARGRSAPGRQIGLHPEDGKPILLRAGRYGPYLSHGNVRATLPKDMAESELTLERAVELLAAKAKSGGRKKNGAKKPRTRAAKTAKAVPKGPVGRGRNHAAPPDAPESKAPVAEPEP
jgi:DNA topoisomerase-1